MAKETIDVNPLVDDCCDGNDCYDNDDSYGNNECFDSHNCSDNNDCFVNYAHLITTRPHEIRRVFVSDLHLSLDEPALVQAFLDLLADCTALPHLMALYILGDWFDMWIGDDAYLKLTDLEKQQHWLTPIINQLQQLNANGCQILVMHGNRDFLIAQALCATFNGRLIAEPYYLEMGGNYYRLEHGDALCTDDVAYQRMRKILRHPLVRWGLLTRPLAKRQQLAAKIRQKSSLGKASKPEAIMDVNQHAVTKALSNADALLHGHTHRPACHFIPLSTLKRLSHTSQGGKARYVLGDWRLLHPQTKQQHVEAVIGMTIDDVTIDDMAKDERDNNDTTISIKDSERFIMVKYRY